MGISFLCYAVYPFVLPIGWLKNNFFSEKTVNWHGFSNIF